MQDNVSSDVFSPHLLQYLHEPNSVTLNKEEDILLKRRNKFIIV